MPVTTMDEEKKKKLRRELYVYKHGHNKIKQLTLDCSGANARSAAIPDPKTEPDLASKAENKMVACETGTSRADKGKV